VGSVNGRPAYGADLRDLAGETHEQRLIRALYHRAPTVPIRAATILGELGSRAAVEALIEVAVASADPYIREAAVLALGRIGDARASPSLDRLRRDGPVRVRMAARRAATTLKRHAHAT
jgi:HEAT repeat protein